MTFVVVVLFFKQKTAYEMRISDWSSDVCSSDLGAPGHGEGHNSGQAMNIVAALAVKDWMVRTHTPGTLLIWPGVAEELLGGKAQIGRASCRERVCQSV